MATKHTTEGGEMMKMRKDQHSNEIITREQVMEFFGQSAENNTRPWADCPHKAETCEVC
jgi:hypothetical protein